MVASESKKIIIVFGLAFVFNFVWEWLHSALYLSYQGGPITILVLMRATLFDAIFITVLYSLYSKIKFFKNKLWVILIISLLSAIIIELYALSTGRWAYNDLMPIIPVINTGLTPTIQLLVLTYLTFKLVDKQL